MLAFPSQMEKIITVKNLVKKYKRLVAVNGISFDVKRGEVFGLLGENGAGKTTTLEMIEGLRRPTSGEITVLGHHTEKNANAVKQRIGVQLQSSAYYNYLNLREILDLFSSIYGSNIDIDELLKMVDLEDKARSYIGNLSGGQRQRFSIVASLVNDPEIVFLDEPTTGLDPLARRNLWGLVSKIKNNQKTIILTTHYMEEAEILCDRVAIMEKGRILAIDETHKLIENCEFPYSVEFVIKNPDKKLFEKIVSFGEMQNVFGKKNRFILKLRKKNDLDSVVDLTRKLKPESYTVGRATLEDVFIELTGKTINE